MPTSRAQKEGGNTVAKLPVAILGRASSAKKDCRENGKGFQVMERQTNWLRMDNREIKKNGRKIIAPA